MKQHSAGMLLPDLSLQLLYVRAACLDIHPVHLVPASFATRTPGVDVKVMWLLCFAHEVWCAALPEQAHLVRGASLCSGGTSGGMESLA